MNSVMKLLQNCVWMKEVPEPLRETMDVLEIIKDDEGMDKT